jgi:hypothetical protein
MHQNHVSSTWTALGGDIAGSTQRPSVACEAFGLITPYEVSSLREVLREGRVPWDLLHKLHRLRSDDYKEHYLQRQSWVLLSLLLAAGEQGFKDISLWDRERLIRMMAYVRKDEDAIPDSMPHGYDDDHDLMRMTCAQLGPVLEAFKAWHLLRQVPKLWQTQAAFDSDSALLDRPHIPSVA